MRPKWRLLAERRAEQVLRFVYVFGMSIVITCATLLFMSLFGRLLIATACSAVAMAHPPVDQACKPEWGLQRIKMTTVCEVEPCPTCPECVCHDYPCGSWEELPEELHVDAFAVELGIEIQPDVLDLRAFAAFQNEYGKPATWIQDDRKFRFENLSPITGQYIIGQDGYATVSDRWWWARLNVHPELPSRWCDLDGDSDVDIYDWIIYARRVQWLANRRDAPPVADAPFLVLNDYRISESDWYTDEAMAAFDVLLQDEWFGGD